MLIVKTIWIILDSLLFSVISCIFLKNAATFKFNAKLCLIAYWIITFVAYYIDSFKTVNHLDTSMWQSIYFFIFLIFYLITISSKIYHTLLTVVAQMAILAICYKVVGSILSIFLPTIPPENFTQLNQLLPYIPYKIIYIFLVYMIQKKNKTIKKLVFSVPFIYIFLPYQTISYISKNYIEKISFQSVEIFPTKNFSFIAIAIFTLLVVIFVCFQFIKKQRLLEALNFKDHLVTIQKKYIATMNNILIEANKFRHDLGNYTFILETMQLTEDIHKVKKYQNTLTTSCEQLINKFSTLSKDNNKNSQNISLSKSNKILNIINTSALINTGFFIINYYCRDIIFSRKEPFALPAYILVLIICFIYFFKKKATLTEVILMLVGLIYSILIFAFQTKYDNLFIITLPLILFFSLLLIRYYNNLPKTFRIPFLITFFLLIINFSFFTLKYNRLLLTFIFLSLFCIFFIIIIFLQNKLIQNELFKKEDVLNKCEKTKEESMLFMNTFLKFKKQIQNIDQNKTMHKMVENYDSIFAQYKTGSSIIDAILCSKYQKCKQHHIKMKTTIIFSRNNGIEELTFARLLFNLLDNSIEAAEKVSDSSREISLSIQSKANFIFIKIKNSKDICSHPLTNKMKTSKSERNHGFGLYIIKDIVNEYHGTLKMNDLGSQFETTITLETKGQY